VTVRRGVSICPGVAEPLYNRDILRLAADIPHLGALENAQARAERRSPVCGSRVAVEVALDGEGRVAGLGQEVKACALGQASAALMGANAIGRSPAELAEARDSLAAFLAGRSDDPGAWPGLGLFAEARRFPARHASILLAFDAAAAAASEAAAAR
jgi:NifU-like protein involved in Fe-S cluster formation